jgi:hypothetical protein
MHSLYNVGRHELGAEQRREFISRRFHLWHQAPPIELTPLSGISTPCRTTSGRKLAARITTMQLIAATG